MAKEKNAVPSFDFTDLTGNELENLNKQMVANIKQLPPRYAQLSEEVFNFRKSLSIESDRGCALMAAAFLDEQLKKLISENLLNIPDYYEKLASGPLNSFASKISLAYMLTLIPKNVYDDLHLIRQIRNIFAHSAEPKNMEMDDIKKICKKLKLDGRPETDPMIGKFRRATMGALAVINAKRYQSTYLKDIPDYDIESVRATTKELVKEIIHKRKT